jgi:hypothetical protein
MRFPLISLESKYPRLLSIKQPTIDYCWPA